MIPIPVIDDWVKAHHYNAILNHLKNPKLKYSYQSIDNWFLNNGSKRSFQDVILATPKELEIIKKKYEKVRLEDKIKYISNTLYTRYFADDKKGLSSNGYSAAKLVEFLGVNVCPYCNRNYIDNIYYSNNGVKRTCQFDHFYNKSASPFLALSICNLVPSCSTCNHIKSNYDIGYSPHDNSVSSLSLGSFNFSIKSIDFIRDSKYLDITFNASPSLTKNKNLFRLEERYKIHTDVVQHIYIKKIIYNDTKLKELYQDFTGIFKNEEELKYFIYGNPLDEKKYHKSPLSKLTSDIYNLI